VDDQFVERAQEHLRQLREQRNHLAHTQRGIQQQLESVDGQMRQVVAAVQLYRRLMNLESPEPPREQPPLVSVDLANMTIADGCEAIMRAQGGQAPVIALVKALQQAGKISSSSRGNYGTIVRTMSRFPDRFAKAKPGVWRLVDDAGDSRGLLVSLGERAMP
jgi:hypothetical protein